MQPANALPLRGNGSPARLNVTERARHTIHALSRDLGPQEITLHLPGRQVDYRPPEQFQVGQFDVIVGQVARCQIHTDLRHVAALSTTPTVLDVEFVAAPHQLPVLELHLRDVDAERVGATAGRTAGPTQPAAPCDVLDIVDELARHFTPTLKPKDITACASRAINDLRRSVSAEALPEMAARLAQERLTRLSNARTHPCRATTQVPAARRR
jgi:hypothetical protein